MLVDEFGLGASLLSLADYLTETYGDLKCIKSVGDVVGDMMTSYSGRGLECQSPSRANAWPDLESAVLTTA